MPSPSSQAGTILWASLLETVAIIIGCGSRHFSHLSSENKQSIILLKTFQSVVHGSLPWICGLFQKYWLGYGNFCKGFSLFIIYIENEDILSPFSYIFTSPCLVAWMPTREDSRKGPLINKIHGKQTFCVYFVSLMQLPSTEFFSSLLFYLYLVIFVLLNLLVLSL